MENQNAYDKFKFNIRGSVDFDQVKEILIYLLDHSESQSKVIGDLQNSLAGYVNNQLFAEKMDSIVDGFDKLTTRLDAIQLAATARVHDKTISAGDLATANYNAICKLEQMVSECITRAEVEVQYQNLYEIRTTNQKIQKDLAISIKMTDDLTKAHANMNGKLGVIEATLPNKVDRSEINYIESLAAKVDLYDEFRTRTIAHLSSLQTTANATNIMLEEHSHHLNSIDEFLAQMSERLDGAALQVDLNKVNEEVKVQHKKLEVCALSTTVDQLNGLLRLLQHQLNQAASDISILEDSTDKILKTHLPSKASIEQVKACVTRVHHDEVITSIAEDLDTKSTILAAEQLAAEIRDLWKRVNDESQRISVAVRFVDWFTNRGENYEHNLQVIDRHLKNLVTPEVPGYPRPTTHLPLSKVGVSSLSPEFIQKVN